MKTFILRNVKPELMITMILLLLVMILVAIVTRDVVVKNKIDKERDRVKEIVSDVALNLTTDKVLSPITVAPQFLDNRAPDVKGITIFPDNHLEVIIRKPLLGDREGRFIFAFESMDNLARGYLNCQGGNISKRMLPNQCRK